MGPPREPSGCAAGRVGRRRHSGGNELSRLRGSERSAAWADDVGRDDLGAPSACRDAPGARAAFLKVASLDFYRKRPRRLRRGGRTAFFPKESGGKERAGGVPRHPPNGGPRRREAVQTRQEPGVHPRPVPFSIRFRRCRALGGPRRSPCKPCWPLRCTGLARRAAIGAMPPNGLGSCGSLAGPHRLPRRPCQPPRCTRRAQWAPAARFVYAAGPAVPATIKAGRLLLTSGPHRRKEDTMK